MENGRVWSLSSCTSWPQLTRFNWNFDLGCKVWPCNFTIIVSQALAYFSGILPPPSKRWPSLSECSFPAVLSNDMSFFNLMNNFLLTLCRTVRHNSMKQLIRKWCCANSFGKQQHWSKRAFSWLSVSKSALWQPKPETLGHRLSVCACSVEPWWRCCSDQSATDFR